MKIIFDVGFWVDIIQTDDLVIFETNDSSGNEIMLRFDKKGFFSKRHLNQMIKDLEKLKEKKQ